MLDVIQFIFRCISQLASMLFSINIGNGLSLGLLMCICFIFLPCTLAIITFLKSYLVGTISSEIIETRRENIKRGDK